MKIPNSKELREKRRFLHDENKRWPLTLKSIPKKDWPGELFPGLTQRIDALRSRDFLVQVFGEPGAVRMSINRTAIDPTGDWQAGITWCELQRLKREAGYGDRQAIEIYPPDDQIVNVANIRHLWIPDNPLPFTLLSTTPGE